MEKLSGHTNEDGNAFTIVRAHDSAAKDPNAYLSLVTGMTPDRAMRVFVMRPGNLSGRKRRISHHGEEVILYVLEGQVEVKVGRGVEFMAEGDCAHFDSAMPHRMTSVGDAPASVLLVISNPNLPVRSRASPS